MKNVYVLIKNNLKISVAQRPINFIITSLIPVIILLLASKILTSGVSYINLGIVDEDNSQSSQYLQEFIKENHEINVKSIESSDLKNQITENSLNIGLCFEEGFENELIKGNVDKIKIKGKLEYGYNDILETIIRPEIINLKNIGIVANSNEGQYHEALKNYKYNKDIIEKSSLNDLSEEYSNSNLFVGFLIMVMFFKASSIAGIISEDRENNIYTRICVAPVNTWQYYLANVVSNIIAISLQVILALLGMKYITNVSIGIPMGILFLILLVVAIISVSLGTLCISLSKDSLESSVIINIVNVVYLMLGGCFAPIEIFPDFIDKISYFSPARWIMESILDLQQGVEFVKIIPNLGIGLLFAITFFMVSAYITNRREKTFISIG